MIVTCETTSTCAHHATVMLRRLAGRDWQVVIGIESHAQIKSRHKLFSQGKNQGASPNSAVAVLDAAFPGTLPVCFLFVFLLLCSLSPDTQSLMRRLGSAHCNCAPMLHSTPLLIRPKTLLLLRSPSRLPNHPAIRSALPLTPIHPFTLFLAPLAKHGLLSIPGTSPIRIKQIQLEQVSLSPSPYPFP